MTRIVRIIFGLALAFCVVGVPIVGVLSGFAAIQVVFGVVASLGLLMALGTVLSRNLVHAALFLVGFFFTVACHFVLLEAEFMAALQVLVYIGAVAILLLFGIMLTRNIQGDETTAAHWGWKLPAGLAGLALFVVLAYGIHKERGVDGFSNTWTAMASRPSIDDEHLTELKVAAADEKKAYVAKNGIDAQEPGPAAVAYETAKARASSINNMGLAVGREMMTRFVVPFELAGLLLTAALVGAIALAWSDDLDIDPPTRKNKAKIPAVKSPYPQASPDLVATSPATANDPL